MPRERLVVFDNETGVFCCRKEVEPHPIAPPMGGAFETTEEEALERLSSGESVHLVDRPL